jgi:hypothetical protein
MEYAVNDRLGAALTAPAPPPVDLPPIEPLPIQPPATNPLVFWQATDVGGALPGGQKVIAAGDMDIYGGGADIWQSRDQFRFIWREVDGEFELTATLAALAMSHEYAKAGLMIRTGNQPEAAFVMIHVFPGGGISLAHRSAAGQPVEEKLLDTFIFPIRLALRRVRGSIEVAYASAEGQWHTERIGLSNAFGPRVLAGLAVLSHDNRYLTTAEFRNIRLLKR